MRGDASQSDARLVSDCTVSVGTALALRYPNGRVAESSLDRKLNTGDRFELYGHTWIAEHWTGNRSKRSIHGQVARLLCVPAVPWRLTNGPR
jgi:hypothetical protein